MKIYLFVLMFFLSLLLRAQVISDGLVGYWPFNGNADDESGSGRHGAIVGNPSLVEDRFGSQGSAYSFNGVDDYIRIQNPFYDFSTSAISVSFWMSISTLDGFMYNVPFSQASENSNNWATNIFGFSITGSNLNPSSRLFFWLAKDYQTNPGFEEVSGSDLFPANEWVHIVTTYDGAQLDLYYNGALVSSSSLSTDVTINSGSILTIGRDARFAGQYYFNGKIDDVSIYNRALSQTEIQALYGEQSSGLVCANIYCDGENVGIGTSDTHGYKLAVAGKTITEEVKVQMQANWPDFVFKDDYELRTLEEVGRYITREKHLPEIPNEAEVTENGINLGEMNAKLLQKIEELTLYLIEQHKKNQAQQAEIEELKRKVRLLKNE